MLLTSQNGREIMQSLIARHPLGGDTWVAQIYVSLNNEVSTSDLQEYPKVRDAIDDQAEKHLARMRLHRSRKGIQK